MLYIYTTGTNNIIILIFMINGHVTAHAGLHGIHVELKTAISVTDRVSIHIRAEWKGFEAAAVRAGQYSHRVTRLALGLYINRSDMMLVC